jgi:hypothetical protein
MHKTDFMIKEYGMHIYILIINMECTLLEQLLNRLAITVHMVQPY